MNETKQMTAKEFLDNGFEFAKGDEIKTPWSTSMVLISQENVQAWNRSCNDVDLEKFMVIEAKALEEKQADILPADQRAELDRISKLVFELFDYKYIAINRNGVLSISNREMHSDNFANWSNDDYFYNLKTTFDYEKYWKLSQVERPVELEEAELYNVKWTDNRSEKPFKSDYCFYSKRDNCFLTLQYGISIAVKNVDSYVKMIEAE